MSELQVVAVKKMQQVDSRTRENFIKVRMVGGGAHYVILRDAFWQETWSQFWKSFVKARWQPGDRAHHVRQAV